MTIRIPNPSRSRALFIIDIQPGFVLKHSHMIPNVVSLIKEGGYDRFVLAEFHADPGDELADLRRRAADLRGDRNCHQVWIKNP